MEERVSEWKRGLSVSGEGQYRSISGNEDAIKITRGGA